LEGKLTFYIPLAYREKWYIAQFVELSHGDVARSLNHLFKNANNGTRTRMCVYLFRQTEEYRELREKAEIKARKTAESKAEV
jgi:hypothetical protein